MDETRFDKKRYIFTSTPSMLLIGEDAEANRSKQIAIFLEELNSYEILLKDLINFPLKEEERNIALNVAYYIVQNEELTEIIMKKKDLPILKLHKITKIKVNVLEDIRDYILTYYIILSNPNYKSIQDYFRIKIREPHDVISKLKKSHQSVYRGIVLKTCSKSIYVITSSGEFVKLKKDRLAMIGQIYESREKIGIKKYKIHIAITLFILLFIGIGIYIQYNKTKSIVVIQTSSNIKLHINSFNKVIYTHSPTERGKKLIKSINLLNADVDDAITDVFKHALDEGMIDQSKKTVITINGSALQYGTLIKTNQFIFENNIAIVINNAGNQQKLPTYLNEEEIKTK